MKTSNNVCFACLMIIALMRDVDPSTCGMSRINETLSVSEFSFINVSYNINVIKGSDFFETFTAIYEVCESNVMKALCTFIWKADVTNINGKDLNQKPSVLCVGKQSNISSAVSLELHISQRVSRAVSVMKLSTSRGEPLKAVRVIQIQVLYPPSVTSMTVDGHDINGSYLINGGHEVNVSCSFDKGNPPAIFRLLEKNGKEMKRADDEGHLYQIVTVQCEDDWPTIGCEAAGSEKNRSVMFLVRCAPKFLDTFPKVVDHALYEYWSFNIRAHTTAIQKCLLTSSLLKVTSRKELQCNVTGSPPELILTFRLYKEESAKAGNWILTLYNEIGSSSTTVLFTKTSPSASEVFGTIIRRSEKT